MQISIEILELLVHLILMIFNWVTVNFKAFLWLVNLLFKSSHSIKDLIKRLSRYFRSTFNLWFKQFINVHSLTLAWHLVELLFTWRMQVWLLTSDIELAEIIRRYDIWVFLLIWRHSLAILFTPLFEATLAQSVLIVLLMIINDVDWVWFTMHFSRLDSIHTLDSGVHVFFCFYNLDACGIRLLRLCIFKAIAIVRWVLLDCNLIGWEEWSIIIGLATSIS